MSRTSMVCAALVAGVFCMGSLSYAGGEEGPAKPRVVKKNKRASARVPVTAGGPAVVVRAAPPMVQVSHCPTADYYAWPLCYNVVDVKYLKPHEMVVTEQVYAVYDGDGTVTTAPLVYVPPRQR